MKFVSLEKIIEEIERIRIHEFNLHLKEDESAHKALDMVLDTIKTLETIPYRDIVQHSSVDDGIKAHAKTYSEVKNNNLELIDRADIEKILSNLWKQDDGHDSEQRIYYNKALQEVQCKLDTLEVKEVNLENEIKRFTMSKELYEADSVIKAVAKHFYELGLKTKIK